MGKLYLWAGPGWIFTARLNSLEDRLLEQPNGLASEWLLISRCEFIETTEQSCKKGSPEKAWLDSPFFLFRGPRSYYGRG